MVRMEGRAYIPGTGWGAEPLPVQVQPGDNQQFRPLHHLQHMHTGDHYPKCDPILSGWGQQGCVTEEIQLS